MRRFAARSLGRAALAAVALASNVRVASAQSDLTQRGLVDVRGWWFPQDAPGDATSAMVDLLAREEVFAKPARWLDLAAGLDLRANSHDQVDSRWRLDLTDRDPRRPAAAIRRLSASVDRGRVHVDVGKQFIRWGKTDLVTPTDRFAPRDFLDVVDNEFLPVTGVRASVDVSGASIEGVWLPLFTPSRTPLLGQRWAPLQGASAPVVDQGAALPSGSQQGLRIAHTGPAAEYSVSVFDGFNNLPDIVVAPTLVATADGLTEPALGVRRVFPPIRAYGADVALPTRWLAVKAEAAYVTSPSASTDEYVLYVVQLERQTGEWSIVGGYAGEAVTERRAALTFAPDRGLARSIIGRASYAIDTNRSIALETAVRQDGRGVYGRGEYSQARGLHWRATATLAVIAGHSDDFLGQYRRNSHVSIAIRYSF